MNKRFLQYQANLRSYLRKRGAIIDVKNKTVKVDRELLNYKEEKRLNELIKWGYTLVNDKKPESYSHFEERFQGESFLDFADEIISIYG